MPIFGITASSNMTTKLTDFYQIATTTLGSTTANITFSSIPQDYKHLQIRYFARTNRAAVGEDLAITFNADGANNYSWHYMDGNGSGATSGNGYTTSRMLVPGTPAASGTASTFGSAIVDILDYTNTNKYKTIKCIGGYDANGNGSVLLTSGCWQSSSAITSLTFSPFTYTNSFVQYTSAALYGIKG